MACELISLLWLACSGNSKDTGKAINYNHSDDSHKCLLLDPVHGYDLTL